MLLIDTDVLIWYMRGNQKAYDTIDNLKGFSISVITYMELVQGMKNKKELNSLRQALHEWNCQLVYISQEISSKAMFFIEQHFLSHSIEIADALIGASAITYGLPLITGNEKHYKVLADLEMIRFSPS